MQWEGKIGPATIAIAVQTAGAIVAVTMMYAELRNTSENTRLTTETLQKAVDRQNDRTSGINDRLIKVETLMVAVGEALAKIDIKVDRLKQP